MKKVTKKSAALRTPTDDQLIEALEAVIRDHRAGIGDIMNRVAESDGEGDRSLRTALTTLLFGEIAIKPRHRDSFFVVNAFEYDTLVEIGHGSASRGARVVANMLHLWVTSDRAGFVSWLIKALPVLTEYGQECWEIGDKGMTSAEAWEVTLNGLGLWAEALAPLLVSREVLDGAGKEFMVWDVIRALATAWREEPWRGARKGGRKRLAAAA